MRKCCRRRWGSRCIECVDSRRASAPGADPLTVREAAAARALATAEKLDPELPYVHFARGIVLDQRDPRRAIEAFRTALAGDPENPRFMLHLGLALVRQGDRREARKLLSRVSELEPEDTLSLMLLADVAIADKDWAEARRLSEDPLTLEQLSAEFGVSRERIRQIEVRAFEKVQKAVRNAAEAARTPPAADR